MSEDIRKQINKIRGFGGGINIENPQTDSYNEIYVNGDKIGYIDLSPARKEYYWVDINLPNPLAICDIKISEKFRNKGYMKQTMSWLDGFTKENGFDSLFLRVDDDSEINERVLTQIYKTHDDDDDIFMYKLL